MTARGWVLFASMALLWGVPYMMIKVAVEGGVSTWGVVFARTAIGALVLLPLALRAGRPTWLRDRWRPLLAFMVIEILIPWWLIADAERQVTSSTAGLLIASTPILTVLIGRAMGSGEQLTALRWTGLGIGMAGVVVLAAPELTAGSPLAIGELMLVAVCYATAPIIAARSLNDVPSLPMTAICLSGAALVYLPPTLATLPPALPAPNVLAALTALAVLCTAVAFLVFFALIREVGSSRALVFTYVAPAVSIAAGTLVLGEPLTVAMVVSFALIIIGSVLATIRPRTPAPVPTTT